MEIIARLREEREALVARIAHIDKMLRQYEEWGREAEQLLSLTASVPPEAASTLSVSAASEGSVGVDEAAQQAAVHEGGIRLRRRAPSVSVQSAKTPIPEFESAVIDVLREAGQPMDRVALYEKLTARGIVIGDGGRGKDLNALSARVYRMAQRPENRIAGERGEGYRLMTDGEAPAANSDYDAADESADDLL